MNYFVIAVLATTMRIVSGTPKNLVGERIVGGEPACIEDYPYQISFQVYGKHYCGAALIRPNVAVTAAHCTNEIKEYLNYMSVRAGSSLSDKGGQVSKLHFICQHPKYDDVDVDYDIAVLFLKQPLVLGQYVKTIPLQPVNQEIRTGKMGTVTGWGFNEWGSPSQQLQVVQVPKVCQSDCVEHYSKTPYKISRMMCFGFDEGGKSSCSGDSGGPIVVDGKLAGIVSWGLSKCEESHSPAVYTKISNPEISSIIHGCIKEFKSKFTF